MEIVALLSLPQQNEFWVPEQGIEKEPSSADPADPCTIELCIRVHSPLSLQCVFEQQVAETHQDWITVMMICYNHSHPCSVTWIHSFIAPLHDGPVDAWNKPRTHNAAVQQPENAVAQPHDDIIKEEEVAKIVEGSSVVEC